MVSGGAALPLEFHPLTPERWPDLEALFGKHGASGGCWCMWWRLTRSEFERQKGQGLKSDFIGHCSIDRRLYRRSS